MSIKITREDFVSQFISCKKAPDVLTTKLEKQPFCPLLSHYVIKPVATDENPFIIHHKNKQPVLVTQKKNQPRRPKAEEVTAFSDSDDDFEKVETDKKRAKNKTAVAAPEVNPQYPASDPSKVIVIGPPKNNPNAKKAPTEEKKAEVPAKKEEPAAQTQPPAAKQPSAKKAATAAASKK